MRRLVTTGRVGHLATVAADGIPHLVPVCFTLVGETAYSAVDHKPKRSVWLRRLVHVRATGRACLLVDHYDEDWSGLWWCGRTEPAASSATSPRRRQPSPVSGRSTPSTASGPLPARCWRWT